MEYLKLLIIEIELVIKHQLAVFFSSPNISNDGVRIFILNLVGGEGNKSVGSNMTSEEEWTLDKTKKYLFRVINKSGGVQNIGLFFTFYETVVW